MTRHLLIVHSEAAPGHDEDDFNDWYDHVHLPEVLKVPGFRAAQRFTAVPGVHGELPEHRYMTSYEIETDDLAATMTTLSQAAQQMPFDPMFDRASRQTSAYTAIGERHEHTRPPGVARS